MAKKDLHDEPFDEGTIAKLQIFEDYAQAWIPTFVMSGNPRICIFDFFAGTGYDKNGVPGSPIRILEKIKEQVDHIFQNKVRVVIYLNEFEPNKKEQKKFDLLKTACDAYLEANPDVKRAIEINCYNEDFEELFPKLLPEIRKYPSLVYLDQNGIKFLSDKYFLELEKTKQTDFLYFVSTGYFWRFGEKEEFKVHLDIDMSEAKKDPYRFIHRSIIKQLRDRLPTNSELRLYPFSIKKGANIYGIIFGAKHPRAIQKFVDNAWKRDEVSGEANFDINDDTKKSQPSLFTGKTLTKKEAFEKNVREKVLAKEIVNNEQLFRFCMDEAHPGKHASDVLRQMKKNHEVTYEGTSPMVRYERVYGTEKRIVSYTVV